MRGRAGIRVLTTLAFGLFAVGPSSAQESPPILKRQLGNGLSVWIAQYHDVPVVQMSLVVPTGTGDDPPGQFGIASLTSALLTRGAGARSASAITATIESLAANLTASSGIDATSVQMHVPASRIDAAVSLMADVVERPTFPQSELDRIRQERSVTLQYARQDPDVTASLVFSRVVYGPSHRYGTSLIGTDETLRGFKRADLIAFHQSAYRPESSTLIVVGDVVAGEVLRLVDAEFGAWRPPADGRVSFPAAAIPKNSSRRVVLIDQPEAPQSRIRIGGVGAARSTSDFFAIEVMNRVLSARLRSYASNAGSGFDMRKLPGPFVAGAVVPTDRTAESLTAFFGELSAMLADVPAAELARAKDDIRLPTFDATGRVSIRLQALETLCVYGLPDDYFATYLRSIQAVTSSDIRRVAQTYLQPDRLAVVIAGDLKRIDPAIRALKLGPVDVMTADDVLTLR
jgi:zinc protease